eukprot:SAG22_NODE_114_length_19318_cov_13.809980_9_plen_209_part_00
MIHGCDWYATFAFLAGEDPTDVLAAASGLPPIDSLNVWPLISGQNTTSPRTILPLDAHSIIIGDYKLLQGAVNEAGWTGYTYPNASTAAGARIDYVHVCGEGTEDGGCLFDVAADRGEHVDLALEQPQRVAAMAKLLSDERAKFFSNSDTGTNSCPPDTGAENCACWMAKNKYGGAFGPFQEIAGVPPHPPPPPPGPPGPPATGKTLT